ncbi:MAG: uracil-DNA glycosylase family protein [Burkholderiales bacterium]
MNLLQRNLDRYLGDDDFLRLLSDHNICVLSDFVNNWAGIDAFWQRFYGEGIPRIMVCGINPGRFGAGKTGIPFLDFMSLSKLIPGIERQDSEKSASFFFEVVRSFGAETFFHTFYVSNFSSVGYLRDGTNLNYHDLPDVAREIVERNFLEEIETIHPTHVISLGKEVHESVRNLLPASIDCSLRLPHPSWVATYRANETNQWVSRYREVLGKFVDSRLSADEEMPCPC